MSEVDIKTFVSGSVSSRILPPEIEQAIDVDMRRGRTILIGDAPGIDLQAQRYLARKEYSAVVVFHVTPHPRNLAHVGWQVRRIPVDEADPKLVKGGKYTRLAQMQKDEAMALEANAGLAVWQDVKVNRFGKTVVSIGTLSNMISLLSRGRPVGLFLCNHPNLGRILLNSLSDLESIIREFTHPMTLEAFEKASKASRIEGKLEPLF